MRVHVHVPGIYRQAHLAWAAQVAWSCELFWAGSISHEYALHYSGGMRQLVWQHHRNRSHFCIDSRLPSELYEQSRFCLAPSGDGWGDRLQKAVKAGCVPVIVQPAVLMPFEDLLPYQRFSLRLGAADIPNMHERLASVSHTEHAKMRRALQRYAPAFNWHEGVGRAYEMAVYALCLRAEQRVCDHLRPALLSEPRGERTYPRRAAQLVVGKPAPSAAGS